jgi:hypothetical protein
MKKRWMVIAFVLTLMACRKDKPDDMVPEEKIKTCSEFLSNYRCVRSDSLYLEGIVDGQRIVFPFIFANVQRKYNRIAVIFEAHTCLDSFNLLRIGMECGCGDPGAFIRNVGDTVYVGYKTYDQNSNDDGFNIFNTFYVNSSNSKTKMIIYYYSPPKNNTNFITITKVNKDTSYVEGSFAMDIKRDSLPNFVLTNGKFRLKTCF